MLAVCDLLALRNSATGLDAAAGFALQSELGAYCSCDQHRNNDISSPALTQLSALVLAQCVAGVPPLD